VSRGKKRPQDVIDIPPVPDVNNIDTILFLVHAVNNAVPAMLEDR
jgi:hypothetical protein